MREEEAACSIFDVVVFERAVFVWEKMVEMTEVQISTKHFLIDHLQKKKKKKKSRSAVV